MYDVLRALNELHSGNSPEVKSARRIIQLMLGRESKTRQAIETRWHDWTLKQQLSTPTAGASSTKPQKLLLDVSAYEKIE
jgi:hypothetical protein